MIAARTFSTLPHRGIVAVAIWLTFALSTSRAELVWSGGRWRVERFGTDTPGAGTECHRPGRDRGPG